MMITLTGHIGGILLWVETRNRLRKGILLLQNTCRTTRPAVPFDPSGCLWFDEKMAFAGIDDQLGGYAERF